MHETNTAMNGSKVTLENAKSRASKNEEVALQWFPDLDAAKHGTASNTIQEHARQYSLQLTKASARVRTALERIVSTARQDETTARGQQPDGDELLNRLNAMTLDELSAHVKTQISLLQSTQDGLQLRRAKGPHKASAKVQDFVLEFDRFLNAYSGIMSIVTLVDAQYGNVASATLSLLFATVKMKSKDEDAIVLAMQQISDRLPDFGTYQKIYPDPALGLMLIDAYRDVILLAREAVSYFQGSTFGRQVRSLGKPLAFETMEKNMRTNFNRVRLKCEALLAQNVDELKKEVKGLRVELKDVREALEGMRERDDGVLIKSMRTALNLEDYHTAQVVEQLEQYRALLASIFDKDRHRSKMTKATLLDDDTGRCWQETTSCLLMLGGCNETGVRMKLQSWLSPMAVDLIQHAFENKLMVAFEICDMTSTVKGTLSRLILQLLERNPGVIRRKDDWYGIEERLKGTTADLVEALLRVINLQLQPVMIVIDRPDWSEEDSVSGYASALLSVVERTKSDLKVLIVHRADLWDLEANKAEIVRRDLKPGCFLALRVDQHRL